MISLPPYCMAKMELGPSSPQYKLWARTLGPDFSHVHHYCAGLNYLNRYYRALSPQDKKFNLQNALNNFNYMVSHAAPSFSLMPEILLNRGRVLTLMGNDAQAVNDLKKALEMNPKLIEAYTVLADYYKRTEQQKLALQTITEGLRHIPESRVLRRRYDELGGKKPYPEPHAATEPAADKKPDVASGGSSSTPKASEHADAKGGSEPDETTIGTPSNPYCRFCPPE